MSGADLGSGAIRHTLAPAPSGPRIPCPGPRRGELSANARAMQCTGRILVRRPTVEGVEEDHEGEGEALARYASLLS
eukprot:1324922-Rhodomonas_salina.4